MQSGSDESSSRENGCSGGKRTLVRRLTKPRTSNNHIFASRFFNLHLSYAPLFKRLTSSNLIHMYAASARCASRYPRCPTTCCMPNHRPKMMKAVSTTLVRGMAECCFEKDNTTTRLKQTWQSLNPYQFLNVPQLEFDTAYRNLVNCDKILATHNQTADHLINAFVYVQNITRSSRLSIYRCLCCPTRSEVRGHTLKILQQWCNTQCHPHAFDIRVNGFNVAYDT